MAKLQKGVGHPLNVGHGQDVGHLALADEPVDPASVQCVKQSIPHDIMVAGLLAAARIRPAKPFVSVEGFPFSVTGEPSASPDAADP